MFFLLFQNNKVVSDSSSTIHKRNTRWRPVDDGEISCTANNLVINDWLCQSVIFSTITKLIDNFISVGSGCNVHHVMSLSISFAPYWPMQGSSYIPTSKQLLRKQLVLSIQNLDDNYCILYAILSQLHPLNREDHPSRPQKHIKFMSELNYEGLEFLMKSLRCLSSRRWTLIFLSIYYFMKIAIHFHFITAYTESVNIA